MSDLFHESFFSLKLLAEMQRNFYLSKIGSVATTKMRPCESIILLALLTRLWNLQAATLGRSPNQIQLFIH